MGMCVVFIVGPTANPWVGGGYYALRLAASRLAA